MDVLPNFIYKADNMSILPKIKSNSIPLIYIDPPFNTGKKQIRKRKHMKSVGFFDSFEDFIEFIKPRVIEAHRILRDDGSLFFHIDCREAHYCKIMLDEVFGRNNFVNEIIWSYDYGGRSKKKWSSKHDTIFWYSKTPNKYIFNYDDIDRIPYLAPSLVGPEKAKRGKTPTDSWWHTIVGTNSKEKTGYTTQKPLGIINRIIMVHSNEGDTVLDFFAGSGTLGEAAAKHGRHFILIDNNPDAIKIMEPRLSFANPKVIVA